jgi:AcrR family transcriptional regulator
MSSKSYHHGDLKNALIAAGVEILAEDGISRLSLRKVALRAGVSHSAPYAHFPDKQSLVAAISTEGFHQLYSKLDAAVLLYQHAPKQQLLAGAKAYAQFALDHKDIFKIMFSSVLEKEKEYPSFVEISRKSFERVVDVVQACQQTNILSPGSPEMMALSVWGTVHGIVSLALEGQIPHTILERQNIFDIITYAIEQTTYAKQQL